MSGGGRNLHERSAMKRADFCACIKCKRNRCGGWMNLQLASYYPNGPIFEEYCCLKCSKVYRVRQVSRGKPKTYQKDFAKDGDND